MTMRRRLVSVARSRSRALATRAKPGSMTERWKPKTGSKYVTRFQEELRLEHGGVLPEFEVTWEQWGDPTLPAARTVYLVPSFSNSSHVIHNLEDPSPGWWEGMVGPGGYIDTNRFRVLCAANLGAPFGTTSPLSPNSAGVSPGQPYGFDFPQITPGDQARVHRRLLEHLGLQRVHAVVGSSMGGMVALQYAALFPDGLARLAVTACTGRSTPGTVALRRVQRLAITSDPDFSGGNYAHAGRWPTAGMRVARELGMICYRSRQEFDQRFDWSPQVALGSASSDVTAALQPMVGPVHEVEQYMEYMGKKFVASRYDPNCYLLQSRSMDLMDIGSCVSIAAAEDEVASGAGGRSSGGTAYADAIRQIRAERVFLCGILQDALIPATELKGLAAVLQSTTKPHSDHSSAAAPVSPESRQREQIVEYHEMSSLYGHDAFFKEFAWLGPRLRNLLEGGIEAQLIEEEQQKPMMAI